MPSFSRKDVERSFASVMVYRGMQYVEDDKVHDVHADSDTQIDGLVEGSLLEAYDVHLKVAVGATTSKITTSCTCPVGTQCKHGAALALYLLQNPSVSVAPQVEAEQVPPPALLPYDIVYWLQDFALIDPDPRDVHPEARAVLIYVLEPRAGSTAVRLMNRAITANGDLGKATELKYASIQSGQMGRHVNLFDQKLIAELERWQKREHYNKPIYLLEGRMGAEIFRRLAGSGRAVWNNPEGPRLVPSEPRRAVIAWETDKGGTQTMKLDAPPDTRAIATIPPFYVAPYSGAYGDLTIDGDPEVVALMLKAPPLPAETAVQVRARLRTYGVPEESLPREPFKIDRRRPAPKPVFIVEFATCQEDSYGYIRSGGAQERPIPFGKLTFEYDGFKGSREKPEIRILEDDRLIIVQRDSSAEWAAEALLKEAGWSDAKHATGWRIPHGKKSFLCVEPASGSDFTYLEQYQKFVQEIVPDLRAMGWEIQVDETYHYVPDEQIDWQVGLDSADTLDWFEFKLGIEVEGQKIDLRPHLLALVKEELAPKPRDYYSYRYRKQSSSTDIFLRLDGGAVVRLPRERLRKLMEPLLELFGNIGEWPDKLQLPANRILDADDARGIVEGAGLVWRAPKELEDLRERLGFFERIAEAPEPEGFQGVLRPYQREGVGWLAFLRENDFGGILADDMGLGKTVQILAHLQTEKNAGRLTSPALIVAPTSTLPNWRREAGKFAPGLRALVLHGPGRRADFDKAAGHDLIITSYPLLSRDKAFHAGIEYSSVVLDEAQNIKNSSTSTAKSACELKARHRLCLSGTPVENHLDELWSLFHFLMPGFLGTKEAFRRQFRTPIEQKHDPIAQAKLARKVRPFMLRRTKAQVVQDLPPKTEILETVDLADAQRDLYESVRVAMDKRVRELLATKGLQKGRIEILDALLKLRQVCCDPRLVKLPSAQKVNESAKLERLLEMLEVLIEDGRRVLLFSQFTSMLDLIEPELVKRRIEWVRITGDTKDRDTPVQRFQAGEVPLFLISLKAGGTGLNLVAADTVIHYDPWWNPAVENQATDRAYRIGQDKPVMVYKLVASGTVEEKVLELQERKAAIARSVVSDDAEPLSALTADDLQAIFS